jgi:hypothetical protein
MNPNHRSTGLAFASQVVVIYLLLPRTCLSPHYVHGSYSIVDHLDLLLRIGTSGYSHID